MSQSIIVYRNPLEQAFWESPYILPAILIVILWIGIFLLIDAALHSKSFYRKNKKWIVRLQLVMSGLFAVLIGKAVSSWIGY